MAFRARGDGGWEALLTHCVAEWLLKTTSSHLNLTILLMRKLRYSKDKMLRLLIDSGASTDPISISLDGSFFLVLLAPSLFEHIQGT